MQGKYIINQARYVDAGKSSTTFPINLSTDRDIIVNDQFNDVINQYNVYLDERENCTKLRLITDVNLIASNVVFNSVTEIVKNEGSPECICLNYEPRHIESTIGKSASTVNWGEDISYAVMDTQITWDGQKDKNYTYLCGIDIFDNHILRSKTKYASHYDKKYDSLGTFNTIDEILTDIEGKPLSLSGMINNTPTPCRRYTKNNTITFLESINKNLIDNNGWLGFLNKTQMLVSGKDNWQYGTERVLNNCSPNKFIDMFPGRDRYSLLPHYNEHMGRFEKNWEYCLTYPFSSATEHIPFINKELDTLKIAFIDEGNNDYDDINKCIVYSISKHGLKPDDSINLYRSSSDGSSYELIEGNVIVDSVIDDYTFSIVTYDGVCDNWVSVFDSKALEKYHVERVGENEYRVEISDLYSGYIYSAETDSWVNINSVNTWFGDGTVIKKYDTVFAVNDYLNLDYDKYRTFYGTKYLPYKRFADWLSHNYHGVGSDDAEVSRAFDALKESFKITATRYDLPFWQPDMSCMTTAINAILSGDIPDRAFVNLEGSGGNFVAYNVQPNDRDESGDYGQLITDIPIVYLYYLNYDNESGDCLSFDIISFDEEKINELFLEENALEFNFSFINALDLFYNNDLDSNSDYNRLCDDIKNWYWGEDFSYQERGTIIERMNRIVIADGANCGRNILANRIKKYFNNEHVDESYPFVPNFSPDGHVNLEDNIFNNYVANESTKELISIGSKNLSFAKVVDDVQCKYYVRIFSRFPNFDFYDKLVDENNIYNEDSDIDDKPISYYSKLEFEKQSTISKLGFYKNIYGDDICQIVYNDDIDLYAIRDNLGRPLTSLYLSFFKTNYGYKEWYCKNGDSNIPNYKSQDVEWSRCFGKIKTGFEYSPHIQLGFDPGLTSEDGFGNIHIMNDVDNDIVVRGLNQDWLGGGRSGLIPGTHEYINTDFDEIHYKNQKYFYGDLCVYSPAECLETSIQDCCNRFNSAQREIGGRLNRLYVDNFSAVTYSQVYNNSASYRIKYDEEPTKHPEGLYYHQNYEIPIRSFSANISEFVPNMINIISAEEVEVGSELLIQLSASSKTYYDMNANPCIYNNNTLEHYKCELVNVLDSNILLLRPIDYDTSELTDIINENQCFVYDRLKDFPAYAEIIPRNSGVIRWRELVQNGFDDGIGLIREYPFTNGALYVNTDINIFLRRQDPFGYYGLSNRAIYYGVNVLMGEKNPIEDGTSINADDTFREEYIKC